MPLTAARCFAEPERLPSAGLAEAGPEIWFRGKAARPSFSLAGATRRRLCWRPESTRSWQPTAPPSPTSWLPRSLSGNRSVWLIARLSNRRRCETWPANRVRPYRRRRAYSGWIICRKTVLLSIRVAGSSPAGCTSSSRADRRAMLKLTNRAARCDLISASRCIVSGMALNFFSI